MAPIAGVDILLSVVIVSPEARMRPIGVTAHVSHLPRGTVMDS